MPRDISTKKPHKTSRPPKAQREAQREKRQADKKKAASRAKSRSIAEDLASRLDGPKKARSNGFRESSDAVREGRGGKYDFASQGSRGGKGSGGGRNDSAAKNAKDGKNEKRGYASWGDKGGKRNFDGRTEGYGGRTAGTAGGASKKFAGNGSKKRVESFEGKTSKSARFAEGKKANKKDGYSRQDARGDHRGINEYRDNRGERAARAGKGKHNRQESRGGQDKNGRQSGKIVYEDNRNSNKVAHNGNYEGSRQSSKAARGGKSGRRSDDTERHKGNSTGFITPTMPASASAFSTAAARAKSAKKSPCSVDTLCGGCEAIALPYEQQLLLKNALVADLFKDVEDDFELRPILGMDDPFRYRNKIISPFAPGKKKQQADSSSIKTEDKSAGKEADKAAPKKKSAHALDCEILTGMYEQGTHKLVPTENCLIENEVGQQVVSAVKAIMERHGIAPYNEDTGEGFMRHVVVRVGHESGEVLVTVVTNEEAFPAGKSFAKELVQRVPHVTTVVQNINIRQTNVVLGEKESVLYGPGFILDTLCGLSFRISSTSFYQVNATQTEVLYNTAVSLAGLTGKETVIDAYCGTGTIGLVAASRGAKNVIGVESNVQAVRDARENARHNGIENATFVAADATRFMRNFAGQHDAEDDGAHEGASGDAGEDAGAQHNAAACGVGDGASAQGDLVLLMDPPRAGSTPEFLQAAAQLVPARIVYVSCNPQTQARDIALLQESGYELQVVQPVDMFPHTSHVECVALLAKKK